MSPRRTRTATAEQSAISTRSKAQKINNVNQDVIKSAQKVRQSQKKKPVKNSPESPAKQSAKKELPDAEATHKKSVKTKKTSRRKLDLDEELETEDMDQNVDSNKSIRMLRNKYCSNVPTVELVKRNLFQLNASKDLDLEKMPNGKLQREISVKLSPVVVTPKSTPPKLSLTPHRSKKTPKKSPISLSSPKTHSIAIPKLFKSPRKLSLAVTDEHSESLEKSDSSSHTKKSRKQKKNSLNSSSGKKSLISPRKKNKHKSDINLMVRRFSKSPKIVLKSPKSKKSKSRKLKVLSPSRMRKNVSPASPDTLPDLNNSSKNCTEKSPLFKENNLSTIKRRLLNSKLIEMLTDSQLKDMLMEPIVLLEKLPPESLKQKNMLMAASKTRADTLMKVKSTAIRIETSSPKLSSMEKSRIGNTNKISPRIKYDMSIQEDRSSSVPLMSSTPQQEKMALMDTSLAYNTSITSVNNTSFNTRLRNQSNIQLSNVINRNADIGNVSEPSLFEKEINDTSQSSLLSATKRDTTYNKDNSMEKKQENNKDNTYELEQPQTLSLRQMIRKRTSTDANLSLRDDAKIVKKAKVRFADVTSSERSTRKLINKLNGSRSSISHDIDPQNGTNIINSAYKSKQVETSRFTRNSLISPFKRSSPRIHAGTPKLQLSRIQVTPKTFASIEKKSEKKSSTKKVPNFARIHEQMFAKSESLVDAKKRLEARHLAFSANKVDSKANVKLEKKPLPSDTRDGIHNRFGFKLKKPEATHIMLKKQVVFSRQKQQHETRMMLKGVRTNRRFELQMKARNLNS